MEAIMEIVTRPKSFTYDVDLAWSGERKGVISAAGKPAVEVATPPEFRGHAGIWSPEDLFVSAVNTCTMTTFLALAARRNLPILEYRSHARGHLEMVDGRFRFTRIVVQPVVTIGYSVSEEFVREALHDAEKSCLIANSITAEVQLDATVTIGSVVAS